MFRYWSFGCALLLGLGGAFSEEKSITLQLVSDARGASPSVWHYTTDDPGTGWADTAFQDESWQTGTGGFGSGTPENSHINSDWSTGQIWLRTYFTLPADVPVQSLNLSLYHDEDVQVFLNGQPIFQEASFVIDYGQAGLPDEAKAALKPGKNVLAIQCANTDGPGYIDAGLAAVLVINATALVGDARGAAPADWSYATSDPGADWAKSDFDASAWTIGKGGFGSADYATGTAWTDTEIWMRTGFNVSAKSAQYLLSGMHDDDMDVYVNGTQVFQATGWNTDYEDTFSDAAASAIVVGKNTLAVHCRNNDGPQFVDAGLWSVEKSAPVKLMARTRLPVSGRGPSLLLNAGSRVDLAALSGGKTGRLTVYGTNGRAMLSVQGGTSRSLSLPASLGTGVFRYRWEGPGGNLTGTLLKLP